MEHDAGQPLQTGVLRRKCFVSCQRSIFGKAELFARFCVCGSGIFLFFALILLASEVRGNALEQMRGEFMQPRQIVLSGRAIRSAEGEKDEVYPVRLALHVPAIPTFMAGQLILDGREGYFFFVRFDRDSRRYFGDIALCPGSVDAAPGGGSLRERLGIRGDELLAGSLFWNVIREAKDDTGKRVIVLEEFRKKDSSEPDNSDREAAKVRIDSGAVATFFASRIALERGDAPLRTLVMKPLDERLKQWPAASQMVSANGIHTRFEWRVEQNHVGAPALSPDIFVELPSAKK